MLGSPSCETQVEGTRKEGLAAELDLLTMPGAVVSSMNRTQMRDLGAYGRRKVVF